MWMIVFHDTEVEPLFFDGQDAERIARETFDRKKTSWNCVLLKEVERG